MKYAIIADIHANLPALEAVLADSESQGCGRVVCLGDIVGHGRQPKECLELVRSRATCCVKGNFDEYCSIAVPPTGFNTEAAKEVEWTRAQLSEEDRKWLRDLSFVAILDGFTLVHSSLDYPQRWPYVFDKLAAAASFAYQTTCLCFYGHTHVPVALHQDGVIILGGTYSKIRVDSRKKYFVNPGSVGQPRDNNPKATYVVYDNDSNAIELRRVHFDTPDILSHR